MLHEARIIEACARPAGEGRRRQFPRWRPHVRRRLSLPEVTPRIRRAAALAAHAETKRKRQGIRQIAIGTKERFRLGISDGIVGQYGQDGGQRTNAGPKMVSAARSHVLKAVAGECDRVRHGECTGMEGSNRRVEGERDFGDGVRGTARDFESEAVQLV